MVNEGIPRTLFLLSARIGKRLLFAPPEWGIGICGYRRVREILFTDERRMSIKEKNNCGRVICFGLRMIGRSECPDRKGKIWKMVGASITCANFSLTPVFARGIPAAIHNQGCLAGFIE